MNFPRRRKLIFMNLLCAVVVVGLLGAEQAVWAGFKKKDLPEAESKVVKTEVLETDLPETAETLPPKISPRELYNRGVELFQIGQIQAEKGNGDGQKDLLKQAIRNFESALAVDPTLTEAQSNIGFAYLTLNDRKRAIKAFLKAKDINPQHLNTLNGLSTAYALDNKVTEALETFETLTKLDPGNPQYFFNKGSVLQKAKRYDEALKAYQACLRLEPEDQRSLFNIGTLLENLGKYDEALLFYQKAKNINISNPIGLESVHRLKALGKLQEQEQAKKSTPNPHLLGEES